MDAVADETDDTELKGNWALLGIPFAARMLGTW
jgi:hypothetical protein